MLDRRIVAFRTASGRLVVMDGKCAHLSADLGRGCVVGESIQCPYHGWRYGADGRCVELPGGRSAPAFARQRCYPSQVRHDHLFFFNGPQPLFPLPFFLNEQPESFVSGRVFQVVGDCAWYLLTANGFDTAHFEVVHDRTLMTPPVVDCPAPYVRRIRFTSRVTGKSLADGFLRRFVGDQVDVTIANWGGPLFMVTARFRRATSYIMIGTYPIGDQRTAVDVLVLAPHTQCRWKRQLLQPVSLMMRRLLTRAFIESDFKRLSGIAYNPHTLTDADSEMAAFFAWLAALPQESSQAARAVNRSVDTLPIRFDDESACPAPQES